MKHFNTIAVALMLTIGALVLSGCTKDPESSTPVNKNFTIDKLFTHDGCTVYRFMDGGHSRYFTKCYNADGKVSSSEASYHYTVSSGKGGTQTYTDANITTYNN